MIAMLPQLKPIFQIPDAPTPGVYIPGLSFGQYGDIPALNASILKEKTQMKMRHVITKEDERFTEDFALGEAAHKAVLEPDLFDTDGWQSWFQYSPTKGLDTQKAQSARLTLPKNVTLITEEILDKAKRIRDAVHDHPDAVALLKNADKELSGHVFDPINGLWRKSRLDIRGGIGTKYIADLKTVKDGVIEDLHKIKRHGDDCGYHKQATYYIDVDALITQDGRDEFYFIFATKNPPYMARVVDMDPQHINDARTEYLERMAMFITSAESNYWPAFQHEGVQRLPHNPYRGKH